MLEFSVDFEIMIYNVKHDFKQVNIEYVFAPLSVYQTYVDCGRGRFTRVEQAQWISRSMNEFYLTKLLWVRFPPFYRVRSTVAGNRV